MNAIKHCYLLAVWLLVPVFAFAQTQQDIETAPPWQLKSYGKKAMARGDIYSAIDYFERFLVKRPDNTKMTLELAHLYRQSRDYRSALQAYQQVLAAEPEKFPVAGYYLAETHMHLAQYDSAKVHFEYFLKAYKGSRDYKLYKKKVKAQLIGCEKAPALLDSILKVRVSHLDTSINKAHIEFSPMPLDDNTMVYASLKADSLARYSIKTDSAELPVKKFYVATKTEAGWQSQGEWKGPFNQAGVHTGNGSFSPDGKRFYFTRCTRNWKGVRICSIYQSTREGSNWSEPIKLPGDINHKKYSSSQPAVGTESSRGREVLYFVSDRPGGRGGRDIWYSIYYAKKGIWKTSKNAGSKINTTRDEMTPWYDNNTRALYFSSNGWPGIGGLDIFKTIGEKNRFPEPTNVGCPFNSSADDLYYILEPDRDEGFFVSNREGGVALKNPTCCDDIYFFSWTEYVYLAAQGRVRSSDDAADPNAQTIVSLQLIDEEGQPLIINRDTVTATDSYFFPLEQGYEYRLAFEQDDHFTESRDVSTLHLPKSDTIEVADVVLKRIEKEKAFALDNIYYEFGKAELTADARKTLETGLLQLMRDNPGIVIEVGAHTDSKGADSFNKSLSRKRAESVVRFLAEGGIERRRMRAKGYGEEQLKMQDQRTDGSWDEAAMQANRRTEFKVIGEVEVVRNDEDDE